MSGGIQIHKKKNAKEARGFHAKAGQKAIKGYRCGREGTNVQARRCQAKAGGRGPDSGQARERPVLLKGQ